MIYFIFDIKTAIEIGMKWCVKVVLRFIELISNDYFETIKKAYKSIRLLIIILIRIL